MKIKGYLTMRNSKGAKGNIQFECEGEFLALSVEDMDKMKDFLPLQLNELFIGSDDWSFRLPLLDDQGLGMVVAWKMPA